MSIYLYSTVFQNQTFTAIRKLPLSLTPQNSFKTNELIKDTLLCNVLSYLSIKIVDIIK